MKRRSLFIGSVLLVAITLSGLALSMRAAARPSAAVSSSNLYVSTDGDCGGMSPCLASIQTAVEIASSGDTILVASGSYTNTGSEVVYIAKAITITGGYTDTDWVHSYPITQSTIVDADAEGTIRRGIRIDGSGIPTITLVGLVVQRAQWAVDRGGAGIHVQDGQVVLRDTIVQSNTLHDSISEGGGGLQVVNGKVVLQGNTFRNNEATDSSQGGGGVHIDTGASAVLISNAFDGNRGGNSGGGGLFSESQGTVVLSQNTFRNNTSEGRGGGLEVRNGQIIMRRNVVVHNSARYEAGISAVSDATIDAQNDLIADNSSVVAGNGVYVDWGVSLTARHWTVANNEECGIRSYGEVQLTNAIVSGHSGYGLHGAGIVADRTLFFNNGVSCGPGASCSGNLFGNPMFADTTIGDYHIAPGSAAVDQAIDISVANDIDGQRRPMRSGWDIGADEQPPAPIASFRHSAPEWTGKEVAFTNTTSVTGPCAYDWDFGDGVRSEVPSPTHVYTQAGDHTVVLTATSYGGTHTATHLLPIYGVQFSSSSPDWLGQTTVFTNKSVTSGTTSYLWEFGDGITSTQKSVKHTYSTADSFPARLTACNFAGCGLATSTVTVYGSPIADFWAHPREGIAPVSIAFSDGTTTVPPDDLSLDYLWHFGDHQTSTLSSPSHIYTLPGGYSVTLTVTNAAGADTLTRTNYITVYESVHADFSASPTSGLSPLRVDFTNTSTGDYEASLWEFGDGVTSTLESPTHTYAAVGAYAATLSIDGPGGTDFEHKAAYIVVEPFEVYLPLLTREG